MVSQSSPSVPMLERLATGIPGLDEVLAGGLVRSDAYLITGGAGTGKTTLANHLAYNLARRGGTTLYVTLLAEQHDRMLAHLRGFRFFDPSLVSQRVHYVSLYDALRAGGLGAVLDQARALVREYRPTLLVVDGAGYLARHAASDVALAEFVMRFSSHQARLGCTTAFLNDQIEPATTHASLLDGIVRLNDEAVGLQQQRFLEVIKLRGVDYLRGRHQFAITTTGIQAYPRLEALVAHSPPVAAEESERAAFGVQGLDEMLRGGLLVGSTTLVLGAPGAGKTTAGLHLLVEGARRGEAGLIATFHETPPRLIGKADQLGLELGPLVEAGRVRILWRPPVEVLLDSWAQELLAAIDEQRPRRLFIEALSDLERLAVPPDRLVGFLTALTARVRARGITTLVSAEIQAVVGGPSAMPQPAISASIENAILLRYVELRSRLHRLLSIVKVRESAYDTTIREFAITERGLAVANRFESAEAVLTGIGRLVPSSAGPSRPPDTETG